MNIIRFFRNISKTQSRVLTLCADILFISISFYISIFAVSFGNEIILSNGLLTTYFLLLLTSLFIFIRIGLYRAILHYIDTKALLSVSAAIAASVIALVTYAFYFNLEFHKAVPFLYGTHLALLVGGSRIFAKAVINTQYAKQKENVVVYGAGDAGAQLAVALRNGGHYHVSAFVDDDTSKIGKKIHGAEVYQYDILVELLERYGAKKLLLAIPSISSSRRQEILFKLENLSVKVQSIPSIHELIEGKYKIDDIHDVDIKDLLGREPVSPNKQLLQANIKDKVVMVTGAGGSIGSELCRQIIYQKPEKLILFELSEYGLYQIEKELEAVNTQENLNVKIYPLLGSVQNRNRLEAILSSFKVSTLYHAAAYKHVPLVEFNVVEGVRNNIFGTLSLAKAAIKANIETFVLISTDKAVRPTNVMGATKRMAELVLQALAKENQTTRFCMVRFGNVLGSSGSVVPLFRKQIANGGPVTITHPEITRYFMTIPEASQLVIQAGAMGKGGDVFVLDMGKPVKIHDLALKMIHLSGLKVKDEDIDSGIEIQYTGLRPGEKLYEELLIGDNVSGTKHERIMTANEQFLPWEELETLINQLDNACHNFEHAKIRQILLKAPTAFSPSNGIEDLVWAEKIKT